MGTFKTLEEAKEFFKDDGFASANGIVLEELDDAHAVSSLVLTERHKNAMGGVMGGAIFTLADFAFATLSNQLHRGTVAQQVSINYLSGTRGSKLFAHASCIKDGRTSGVYTVKVTDDLGRDIALFTAVAFKK